MPLPLAFSTLDAASLDLIHAVTVGAVTVAVILVGALVVALAFLFRRRSRVRLDGSAALPVGRMRADAAHARGGTADSTRAGAAPADATQLGAVLVRADDAVEAAENEVGFAIAQFGPDRTRPFADAVASARAAVAEAFRLKQKLDDAPPESDQQRRDLARRVLSLAESARAALEAQESEFTALRRSEAESPARLAALREGIASTRDRLPASRIALARLAARYSPECFANVSGNADTATRLLEKATQAADDAASRISQTGVNTAAGLIDSGASLVHDARLALAAIDDAEAALARADATLSALIAETGTDLDEARSVRDNAPDAESGALVLTAIAQVEKAVAAVTGAPDDSTTTAASTTAGDSTPASTSTSTSTSASTPASTGTTDPVRSAGRVRSASVVPRTANPVAAIERIGNAVASLDTALAGARNQKQRLDHARTALVGALVGARSQISVTRAFMATSRTGVDARTRMAEAERQLMLAESESDPVAALDAARRATTAAQDADALAHYDAL
jgi:hypothetical protein